MPRTLSTAMLTALASPQLSPAFFFELNFPSGPVYVWSGDQPISWNGQAWLGGGKLLSLSAIEEGSTVEAKGIQLGFGGFDASLLPDVMTDYQLGLPVTVYLGLFATPVTYSSLIATPATSWAGRMDQPSVEISGQTAKITINCESRLMDMNRSCGRRYTPEDQQRDWPGDLGMQWVPMIQQITLYWGVAPTSQGNI